MASEADVAGLARLATSIGRDPGAEDHTDLSPSFT